MLRANIITNSYIALPLLGLLLATSAFAQETVTTAPLTPSVSASVSNVGAAPPKKNFSLTVGITTETNLEEQDSAQDESATTLELLPSYRISSKARVQALLAAERSYNGLQETKVLNTTLGIARDPIRLNDDTKLGLGIQALLPTDEEARDKSSLRGGAGATVNLVREFKLLNRNATASVGLNGLKYSHKFSRNADLAANISHRLRYTGGLDVNLSKKVDAGISGYYQTGFTYDNVVREAYLLEESLSYNLKSNVALAVSHSTGGSLFEKEGREWAASFYDKNKSTVGARITVVY